MTLPSASSVTDFVNLRADRPNRRFAEIFLLVLDDAQTGARATTSAPADRIARRDDAPRYATRPSRGPSDERASRREDVLVRAHAWF